METKKSKEAPQKRSDNSLTLLSKSAKLANPPPPPPLAPPKLLSPNASPGDLLKFGPVAGRGGGGRIGGFFAFGGNAGLGDSGRLGGWRPIGLGASAAADPAVGAWSIANGSLPNASAAAWIWKILLEF